jgi:hypothetical protein
VNGGGVRQPAGRGSLSAEFAGSAKGVHSTQQAALTGKHVTARQTDEAADRRDRRANVSLAASRYSKHSMKWTCGGCRVCGVWMLGRLHGLSMDSCCAMDAWAASNDRGAEEAIKMNVPRPERPHTPGAVPAGATPAGDSGQEQEAILPRSQGSVTHARYRLDTRLRAAMPCNRMQGSA